VIIKLKDVNVITAIICSKFVLLGVAEIFAAILAANKRKGLEFKEHIHSYLNII
jgi:hypothetical protein